MIRALVIALASVVLALAAQTVRLDIQKRATNAAQLEADKQASIAKSATDQSELAGVKLRNAERRAANVANTVTIANEVTHDVEIAPDLEGALIAFAAGRERVRQSGYAPIAAVAEAGAGGSGPNTSQ